jgi:hypothetical protein
LLTIAGFAVFSTRPVPTTSSTSTSVAMEVPTGRGGVAGRLAASAFSPVVTPPPTTTSTTIAPAERASTSESNAPPETTPQETEQPETAPPETEPPEKTPPDTTTTTTEPPQTTEPPTTVAPGADPPTPSPLSEAEMRALAAVYFTGDDVDTALQVSYCESQWDASAYNPLSGASGLFQHLPGGWEERAAGAGFAGASPFDAEANTAAAAWLVYQGGGWWHWDGRCAVDG